MKKAKRPKNFKGFCSDSAQIHSQASRLSQEDASDQLLKGAKTLGEFARLAFRVKGRCAIKVNRKGQMAVFKLGDINRSTLSAFAARTMLESYDPQTHFVFMESLGNGQSSMETVAYSDSLASRKVGVHKP